MRISDWSSDVCSSDLVARNQRQGADRTSGRTGAGRRRPAPATTSARRDADLRTDGVGLSGRRCDQGAGPLGRRVTRYDTTLPLSAASLLMSFRTMFDPERAEALADRKRVV